MLVSVSPQTLEELTDTVFPAPLKSSERRKLRQKVVEKYSLTPEIGDLLVPEGLQSQKFSTHVNEHGVRMNPSLPGRSHINMAIPYRSRISHQKVTRCGLRLERGPMS